MLYSEGGADVCTCCPVSKYKQGEDCGAAYAVGTLVQACLHSIRCVVYGEQVYSSSVGDPAAVEPPAAVELGCSFAASSAGIACGHEGREVACLFVDHRACHMCRSFLNNVVLCRKKDQIFISTCQIFRTVCDSMVGVYWRVLVRFWAFHARGCCGVSICSGLLHVLLPQGD